MSSRRLGGSRFVRLAAVVLAGAVFALGVGASGARPAGRGQVTISLLAFNGQQSALTALVANFERVYPDINVQASYVAGTATLYQVETTELAAGNAPDLLATFPGCGTLISICALAKAGDLAPMIKVPWTKRSLPLVTSLDKHDNALYAFSPAIQPFGILSNDDVLHKLGLRVPQTFAQLLDLCQAAKNHGIAAFLLPGTEELGVANDITALAIPLTYGRDRHWTAELKAGTVSFEDSAGWRQALNEFVEMSDAGCFEPGATGETASGIDSLFAQGQGLLMGAFNAPSGAFDFPYSFHPFPSGTAPGQTTTFVNLNPSLSINAHSSATNQAAAQTFVDFLARPKENALYSQINGSRTQYEFLKEQLPPFMSSLAPVLAAHQWVINPQQTWWNAGVQLALFQDDIGLLTGQETPDSILQAMDAAWKQGPS